MATISSLSSVTDILDTDQVMITHSDGQSFKIAGTEINKRNQIIIASGTTITGTPLKTGNVVRVYFTADILGADTTSALVINYNGTNYNVKAPKNGSLVNFVASNLGGSPVVYKYLQAYTTLELLYDGTQFVIIGNPVVISTSDYTIYADGLKREDIVEINNKSMVTSNAVCSTFRNLTKKTAITTTGVTYRKLTFTRLNNYSCGVFMICSRDNLYFLEVKMNSDGVTASLTCLGSNSYITKAEFKSETNYINIYFTIPAWAITFEVTQLNFCKTMDFSVDNISSSDIPTGTTDITIKTV